MTITGILEVAMKWQQLLIAIYQRMYSEYESVIEGLTVDELNRRPSPGANPIGWILWHAARSLDRTVGDVISGEQLWTKDRWHARFNLPPNPLDTGYGHTDAQVDEFRVPDAQTLLEYYGAVMDVNQKYLENLSEEDLDNECVFSVEPGTKRAIYLRIVANIYDSHHIGQAAYVKGLVKGHRWSGI
jgi:hypothetical protein